MRIGIISKEYFGFKSNTRGIPMNAHGGFGFLARKKAEALAAMGHEVHVFVPRFAYDGNNREPLDTGLNGVNLHFFRTLHNIFAENTILQRGLRGLALLNLGRGPLDAFLRENVDIFLSEDPFQPSLEIVKRRLPHMGIFQDPFDDIDYSLMREAEHDYLNGNLLEPRFVAEYTLRSMEREVSGTPYSRGRILNRTLGAYARSQSQHELFAEASFISEKLKAIFNLKAGPSVLRNPIDVPHTIPEKSDQPSVVWLARWDPQKRPEVALKTAKEMPEIQFYFIGTASGHPVLQKRQTEIRSHYVEFENIHILDFVSEEEKTRIMDRAWVLLNSSVREGLPISFLEAGAHGCSIVSSVDPDNYASRFGAFVRDGNFKDSISALISSEECFVLGRRAHEHMEKFHETGRVMEEHVKAMDRLLEQIPQ